MQILQTLSPIWCESHIVATWEEEQICKQKYVQRGLEFTGKKMKQCKWPFPAVDTLLQSNVKLEMEYQNWNYTRIKMYFPCDGNSQIEEKLNKESNYVHSFKWFLESNFRILVSKKNKRS